MFFDCVDAVSVCEHLHHFDVQLNLFFQANIGQDEDFEAAQKKAESLGAKKVRDRMKYDVALRTVCVCVCVHVLIYICVYISQSPGYTNEEVLGGQCHSTL